MIRAPFLRPQLTLFPYRCDLGVSVAVPSSSPFVLYFSSEFAGVARGVEWGSNVNRQAEPWTRLNVIGECIVRRVVQGCDNFDRVVNKAYK